jgi:outer membrane protein OmpA-like peptidoglycan-associated protein
MKMGSRSTIGLAFALAFFAISLGCNEKKKEEPKAAVPAPAPPETFETLEPKLKEMEGVLASLRQRLSEVAEDAPGREELLVKLSQTEEVIGVVEGEHRWIASEMDAAAKAGDQKRIAELKERVAATAKGLADSRTVTLDLAHKVAELQSFSKQVEEIKATMLSYKRKLATGYEVKGAAGGFEQQLIEFIEDPKTKPSRSQWFVFDHLVLASTGTVVDVEKSKLQLENVAEILKAYPKVKLELGAFTDNAGPAPLNKKLSTERAVSIAVALAKRGVEVGRLEAKGHGADKPLCPANDSDACRTKNKRIAALVIAK